MKVCQLLTEQTWTRGAYAKDRHGCTVDAKSEQAEAWCLVGAVKRCSANEDDVADILDKIVAALQLEEWHYSGIAQWNDAPERTAHDVIALVTRLDI